MQSEDDAVRLGDAAAVTAAALKMGPGKNVVVAGLYSARAPTCPTQALAHKAFAHTRSHTPAKLIQNEHETRSVYVTLGAPLA